MICVNGRLHSTEKNVNVIAGANEIFDDDKGKRQSEINTETYALVNDINERLNGLSPEQQSALAVAAKANKNEANLGYYVCGTEANVAAKIVANATGYILAAGGSIKIKMNNANNIANATLNINSTGDRPLYYNGKRASATNTWEANETVEVYFDGNNYYANNVSNNGKFSTGEKVGDVGIDDEPTAGSDNLVKSGGVEKYLAQDNLIVPDPSRTMRTFVRYDGQVETVDAYSIVTGIELKPGEIIFLNQGNVLYTSANGAVLFETDSEGNIISPFNCIVRGIGGETKVSYKNTSSNNIYVGLCAYDYSTVRQCGYKIWKGNKVAAADEDLQSEIQRATQAENNKLSFTESQSLTPTQQTQALSNLGISGTETTVNPESDKLPTSKAVYEAISQRSKILTLIGNNTTYVNNGAVVDGFIPGHTYRFTILNYDEWELPTTLQSTNTILKIWAYNNKECVSDSANGKYKIPASVEYQYQQFTSSPQKINRTFDYRFTEKINNTDIYNWYIKVEGRALSGCVLKISAEDITGIGELEKDNKINSSSDEWVAFDGGDGYVWGLLPSPSNMNLYLYSQPNTKGYYYKAKAGDMIRVHLNTGYNINVGILALKTLPRESSPFTYLLQTSSVTTVNSSTITITEDCYVYFCYEGSAIVYIKNTGVNKKIDDVEEEISNIQEDINELRSDSKNTVVIDSTAFNDKKLLLSENRGYYFDDNYSTINSYEDTSYLDRKCAEIPDGKHFIFLTDSHIDYTTILDSTIGIGFRQKETDVIKYVRDRLGVKNVIFGGDVIGRRPDKYKAAKVLSLYVNEKFDAFGEGFLFVVGNHDTNAFKNDSQTWDEVLISDVEVYKRTTGVMEKYGKIVFPQKLLNIIETSNDLVDDDGNPMTQAQKEEFKAWTKMNYYYDDDKQKIRYIVMETADCGNTMRDIFGGGVNGGDSRNSLCAIAYFIKDALSTVQEGYDVVVLGHWILHTAGPFWPNIFYKMLAAYKNKTSVNINCAPDSYGHLGITQIVSKTFDNPASLSNLVFDFTNSVGSGRIFVLGGHEHYDRALVIRYGTDGYDGAITNLFDLTTSTAPQSLDYDDGDILVVVNDRCCAVGYPSSVPSQAYAYPSEDDETRLGTVTEVLFEVVTITPDNRVVFTRFGAQGSANGLPYIRDYVLPMRSE